MTSSAVKITSKGQVTIPKAVREKLNASAVYFEVKNDVVMVRPVRDAAASLNDYAKNVKPGASMRHIKDKAWEAAISEKAGKKSSRH